MTAAVGSDTCLGLTRWDGIDYENAAKTMKAALEQGANFWNGVSREEIPGVMSSGLACNRAHG